VEKSERSISGRVYPTVRDQVVKLRDRGYSDKEIAALMSISVRAVELAGAER
jgi:predicted transcriptional regulator